MEVRHFILLRKVSLVRALYLRFGPAWVTRVRASGINFDSKKFCTTSHWGPELDRLERLARDYGFICPLDDLGPAKDYLDRLQRALKKDLDAAVRSQNPMENPTAGSLENSEHHPNAILPLGERIAKEFGLPPIPVTALPGSYATPDRTIPAIDRAVTTLTALGFPADRDDLLKVVRSKTANRPRRAPRAKVLPAFRKLKRIAPAK